MIFHELATNASKYGALSAPDGQIAIFATVAGEECQIEWIERGGPPIIGEPSRQGFGTKLATISSESHLGGSIERKWMPEGLHMTLRCSVSSLRRP